MGNTIKNLSIILGIATVGLGAYYLYIQKPAAALSDADAEQSLQTMLANTSVFISHSQELDMISLDLTIFEDERFRSLRTYSPVLQTEPVGRSNPFSDVGGGN